MSLSTFVAITVTIVVFTAAAFYVANRSHQNASKGSFTKPTSQRPTQRK